MAVNALERYLGDHALAQGWSLPAIEPLDLHRGRIGVIGAGPAGLSFAWQMVRQGWARHHLRRRPESRRHAEVRDTGLPPAPCRAPTVRSAASRISAWSSRWVFRIGRDIALDALRSRHALLFLAIGASEGRHLGLPGEEGEGVFTATDYLQ